MISPDEIVQKINTRILELKQMEKDCIQMLQTKQADLNAILGAQQDCQYWLSQVAGPALPVAAAPTTPPAAFTPDTTGGASTIGAGGENQAANPLDAVTTDDVDQTVN